VPGHRRPLRPRRGVAAAHVAGGRHPVLHRTGRIGEADRPHPRHRHEDRREPPEPSLPQTPRPQPGPCPHPGPQPRVARTGRSRSPQREQAMTTRVVIAHRSTVIRDVVRLLGASRAVVVVGETSRPAALAGLCRSEHPDVTIAEATFEDGTEIESLLTDLQATDTRTLVVGGDPSPERLTRALLLGASGYLHDDASLEQVVEAIGAVADGGSVPGPTAAATILEQWRRLREHKAEASALTARELDVLVAMAEGLG